MPLNLLTYVIGYAVLLIILVLVAGIIYGHMYIMQMHVIELGYKALAEYITGQVTALCQQGRNLSRILKYPIYGPDGAIYTIIIAPGSIVKKLYPLIEEELDNQSIYVVVRSIDPRFYGYKKLSLNQNIVLGTPSSPVNYYLYSSTTNLYVTIRVSSNYIYVSIEYRGLRRI